jgi:hypothetical protein
VEKLLIVLSIEAVWKYVLNVSYKTAKYSWNHFAKHKKLHGNRIRRRFYLILWAQDHILFPRKMIFRCIVLKVEPSKSRVFCWKLIWSTQHCLIKFCSGKTQLKPNQSGKRGEKLVKPKTFPVLRW